MSRKVETTTDLRVNNRKELLNLLIRKGSATRNELKDETKFSYTTTGNLIGDLHEAGFVWQTGVADSTGGRRAQIVKLNADNFLFIAIGLSPTKFRWGLYNIQGHDLLRREYLCDTMLSMDENFSRLLKTIHELCNPYKDKIKSIGIVIPGQYDSKTDCISDSSYSEINDILLHHHVLEHFLLPVFVMNDVRVAAYNELMNKSGNRNESLVFLMILRESLGASIIINGEIYGGAAEKAGEVYALPVWTKGVKGLVGDLLSPDDDIEKLSKLLGEKIDETDFFELFRNGNPHSIDLFNKNVEVFSYLITMIVSILNPSDIVIGGFYNQYGDSLITAVLKRLNEIGGSWRIDNLCLRFSDITPYTLVDAFAQQQISHWLNELWAVSLESDK